MRDDRERIQDILDAISHIEKYASKGRKAFDDDELVQIWMIYHLEIIEEAVRKVSSHQIVSLSSFIATKT